MKIEVDKRYLLFGLMNIVGAILHNVNVKNVLSPKIEQRIQEQQNKALKYDETVIKNNKILEGYRAMIRKSGRSLKKYPPTAEALINNIKDRGHMPRINSIVDIYNMEVISNFLSIGAHDYDKISQTLCFTFAEGEEIFYPIGGGEKRTVRGDFLYRDENDILAYLDARDSELYKISEETKYVILIVQGNANTSKEYRENSLKQIVEQIIDNCGGQYEMFSVDCGNSIIIS
jgi:DNA/RNA-binding domain of Phe-tRNA-synthetase-like protein